MLQVQDIEHALAVVQAICLFVLLTSVPCKNAKCGEIGKVTYALLALRLVHIEHNYG
jgi:hypothetical protein